MPRKNKGFSEVLYVYLSPENKKFLEKEKDKALKTDINASYSDYLNKMLDRKRAKAAGKKA